MHPRLENRTCLETPAQVPPLTPTVAARCLVPVLDYLATLPSTLSPTEALTELVLTAMQQLHGPSEVWPSLERIGELAHCSRISAKRAVRSLEERRRIEVERAQYDGEGRQLSSRYRVLKAGVYGGIRMIRPLRKASPDPKRENLREEEEDSSTRAPVPVRVPSTDAKPAAARAAPTYAAERAAYMREMAAIVCRFGSAAELDVLEVLVTLGAGQPVAIALALERLLAAPDVPNPGGYFRTLLRLALDGRLGARSSSPPTERGETAPPVAAPKKRDTLREEHECLRALLRALPANADPRRRQHAVDQLAQVERRLAERAAGKGHCAA